MPGHAVRPKGDGSTLWDLLARSDAPAVAGDGPLADRREAEWIASLRGDAAALSRRLEWDDADPGRVRAILGRTESSDTVEAWARELRRIYGGPGSCAAPPSEEQAGSCRSVLDPDAPIPFQEVFTPAILDARHRLRRRSGRAYRRFSDSGHAALERLLLGRLCQVTARALLTQFFVFRSRDQTRALAGLLAGRDSPSLYQEFIRQLRAGGIHQFFTAYPVAGRLCVRVIDLWIDATDELIRRVDADHASITRTFADDVDPGPVVHVAGQVADVHSGGRAVKILSFRSGLRIVYKPRPLSVEAAFGGFVGKLTEAEPHLPPLRTVRIEDRGEYGWSEFIEPRPCEDEAEIERFYFRTGMLVALVYALGGSDFHMENLIATGEHPVLIDLESLLTPMVVLGDDSGAAAGTTHASRMAADSVLGTQLLPSVKTTQDGQVQAVGGISGPGDSHAIDTSTLAGVNSDAMRLRRARRDAQPGPNVPRLGERAVDAGDFEDQVVAGFGAFYRVLMRSRLRICAPGGFADMLRGLPIRFIPRHTSLYATLLERCLHPRYLTSGIERSIQIDALGAPFLRKEDRPALWPLLAAERRALEQLDIPLFLVRSDSRTIVLEPGQMVKDGCEESPLDRALSRLRRLSEHDLDTQVGLIRGAFAANRAVGFEVRVVPPPSRPAAEQCPWDAEGSLRAAERIGVALARRAQGAGGPSVGWIAPSLIPAARRYAIKPSASLFDGTCGIALFLAALDSVRPSPELARVVRRVTRDVAELEAMGTPAPNRRTLDPGAGTGLASVALGMIRIAGYTGDDAAMEAAGRIVAYLASCDPGGWRRLDLLSGAAGAPFVMMALHEAVGDESLLDGAIRFARHLLEQRHVDAATGLRTWATWRGEPEVGFAGTTGIAHTLLLVADATGEEGLRHAAEEGLEYDRRVLAPWLSGEDRPQDREAAYVTGAAGLGALGLRNGYDPNLVDRAVTACVATPWAGGDDFCSGACGRLDFLVSAGHAGGRTDLIQTARTLAADLGARWHEKRARLPRWAGLEHPGLFQGEAGLGYTLLRVGSPHLVRPLFV